MTMKRLFDTALVVVTFFARNLGGSTRATTIARAIVALLNLTILDHGLNDAVAKEGYPTRKQLGLQDGPGGLDCWVGAIKALDFVNLL